MDIICPHCKAILEGDESLIGEIADCPNCKRSFVVSSRLSIELSGKTTGEVSKPCCSPGRLKAWFLNHRIHVFALLLICSIILFVFNGKNKTALKNVYEQTSNESDETDQSDEKSKIQPLKSEKNSVKQVRNESDKTDQSDEESKMHPLKSERDSVKRASNESAEISQSTEENPTHPVKTGEQEVVKVIDLGNGVFLELVLIPLYSSACYMGKYEITCEQWDAVMKSEFNPRRFEYKRNPQQENGHRTEPVVNVSFSDCESFVSVLMRMPAVKEAGVSLGIPSANEWQKACYADATGEYCKLTNGTEITTSTIGKVAWIKKNSNGTLHPVGQKEPNSFGLFDMFGNAEEFTSTRKENAAFRDVLGSKLSTTYDTCGGSWNTEPSYYDLHHGISRGGEGRNTLGLRICGYEHSEDLTDPPSNVKEIIEQLINEMVPIPGKNYSLGKFEVTQKQWNALMRWNPSWVRNDDYPVTFFSLSDCQEFLKRLNERPETKKAGLVFRLPTDSEWKFACLAGASGEYCMLGNKTEVSDDTVGQVAWYEDNSDREPHAVGQKYPNAFGLYDMLGNVCELCLSPKRFNPYESVASSCGGTFRDSIWECNASTRDIFFEENDVSNCRGFRLCAQTR